jgi:hypothetical protein
VKCKSSGMCKLFVRKLLIVMVLMAGVAAPASRAMSVIAPTFAGLVQRAEQVVRARAIASNSRWDATPQGGWVIHTYVQFQVIRTLKGSAPETITLQLLGGQVGDTGMVIPDMPSFEMGSTYVLFIAQNGRAFCPLVGVMHGAYRVVTDPATGSERITRSNGAPLGSTSGVSTPIEGQSAVSTRALGAAMARDDFENAIVQEMGRARHE